MKMVLILSSNDPRLISPETRKSSKIATGVERYSEAKFLKITKLS